MTDIRITTAFDNFSGRSNDVSDSAVDEIQFHVYCEELIRRYYGRVNEWTLSLAPAEETGQAIAMQRVEEAVSQLGAFTSAKTVHDGKTQSVMYAGEQWAVRAHAGHHWDLDDDSGDGDAADFDPPLRRVSFTFLSCDPDLYLRLYTALAKKGFEAERSQGLGDNVPVYLAVPDERRGVAINRYLTPSLPFDQIAGNYTQEVGQKFERLIGKTLKEARHGIIVLSGPPGTGKSYLVRSLLSETKRKAVICSPASLFLREARHLSRVTEHFRRSLVILEDVGEYLSEDNVSAHPDVAATLLNYSDGLLSLVADCVFVLTFNADVGRISEAVTRPGRCLAQIHVGKLPAAQAQNMVDFPIPGREYSLAEVYQMREEGAPMSFPADRRAGFRTG